LNEDSDSLVWCYTKSGVYSSQPFYSVISFKLATVDNLNRKGMDKPVQCCFCNENETVDHLFFQCVVAKVVWKLVGEVIGCEINSDYLSVASKWINKNKCYGVNIFTTELRSPAVLPSDVWSLTREPSHGPRPTCQRPYGRGQYCRGVVLLYHCCYEKCLADKE
jgi:hypothetical protein